MKNIKIKQIVFTALLLTNLITSSISVQAKQTTYQNNIIATAKTYDSSSTTDSQKQEIDTTWGLGKNQTEYIKNNKSYNWYIDQGNTGKYSDGNCGPTSTAMVSKWVDESFSKTAEDVRNSNPKNGSWWSTNDITNYFDSYKIKYSIENLRDDTLKSKLKQGNIAILCIDTSYIPYNNNPNQRVGRFYDFQGGHFIVVKGYRIVDGKTYFEAYDPNNWNEHYQDGQEKGKDRYFLSEDLMKAARNNWNYSIIINPKTSPSKTDSNIPNNSTTSKDSVTPNDTIDSTNSNSSKAWNWFNWFNWFN
ncbi:C39 family peptidase [Clostridium sp. SHJSY1]|uniref:C39 family peptidase n=1 Tax=Clostridium sp. SHJSY1 TaxID=2942483 RepID=UPI0028752548|nr:C39 family peptidase [Clostridium sp. SHJSY1]MDS0527294.1 C39 family peptidase [Clostridium sp. SHJSY1]